MRFELVLRFSSSEVESMSDWSQDAAQRYLLKKQQQHTQDEKVLHDQKVLDSNCPTLWSGLRDALTKSCDDFNNEPGIGTVLGYDNTDPNSLRVYRAADGLTLTTAFDPKRHEITFGSLAGGLPTLKFKIVPGTSEVHLFEPNGVPIESVVKVANRVINALLGI
jgi:hypothetical protein